MPEPFLMGFLYPHTSNSQMPISTARASYWLGATGTHHHIPAVAIVAGMCQQAAETITTKPPSDVTHTGLDALSSLQRLCVCQSQQTVRSGRCASHPFTAIGITLHDISICNSGNLRPHQGNLLSWCMHRLLHSVNVSDTCTTHAQTC
jgi:hypothetical protein